MAAITFQLFLKYIDYHVLKAEATEDEKEETGEGEEKEDSEFQDYDVVNDNV